MTIPEPDKHNWPHEDVRECFVTCICTSEKMLHLRLAIFDEDPSLDDGTTICDRRRTKDVYPDGAFWDWDKKLQTSSCYDCILEVDDFVREFFTREYDRPIKRDEAERIVAKLTTYVGQYKAVPMKHVERLLGDRCNQLKADPIRRLGPTADTVYPWNVVDYLSCEEPPP